MGQRKAKGEHYDSAIQIMETPQGKEKFEQWCEENGHTSSSGGRFILNYFWKAMDNGKADT